MVTANRCILVLALLVLCTGGGEALVVKKKAKGWWTYVAKFTFDVRDHGNSDGAPGFEYWVDEKAVDTGYRLVLYNDAARSWGAARDLLEDENEDRSGVCKALSTCDIRERGNCSRCMMKFCDGARRLGTLNKDGKGAWQVINQYSRPRIWYVAVTNCGSSHHPVDVHVTFLNPGSWWRRQFGVDEQGVLEFQCILTPVFALMAGGYGAMTFKDYRRQGAGAKVHAVVKWFLVVIVLQLIYYLDKLRAYANMAASGSMSQFAGCEAAAFIAAVMFMMLLLNFATGFTAVGVDIFTPLKDARHQQIIIGIGAACVIIECLAYSWHKLKHDPMDSVTYYQMWPVIILASLRFPIAVYYGMCLRDTMRNVPEQRGYYRKWGLGFFLYIIALPVLMIIAHAVSPHVRFRAVDCTADVVTLVSMCFMCYLLWPGASLTVVLVNTYSLTENPEHVPMHDGATPALQRQSSQPPQRDTEMVPLEDCDCDSMTSGLLASHSNLDALDPRNDQPLEAS